MFFGNYIIPTPYGTAFSKLFCLENIHDIVFDYLYYPLLVLLLSFCYQFVISFDNTIMLTLIRIIPSGFQLYFIIIAHIL